MARIKIRRELLSSLLINEEWISNGHFLVRKRFVENAAIFQSMEVAASLLGIARVQSLAEKHVEKLLSLYNGELNFFRASPWLRNEAGFADITTRFYWDDHDGMQESFSPSIFVGFDERYVKLFGYPPLAGFPGDEKAKPSAFFALTHDTDSPVVWLVLMRLTPRGDPPDVLLRG